MLESFNEHFMAFKIAIKLDGQVLFMYCDPLRNELGTSFEELIDDNDEDAPEN